MTFGGVLHPSSNPCISYIPVGIFAAKQFGSFFCLSLLYHCRGCICQRDFSSFFLVTWRFSTLSPVALACLLQGILSALRGLGFYGLISGCINCSDRRWWWLGWRRRRKDGAFLTGWVKSLMLKLWSFIPQSAGGPCWRAIALGSIPNLYSSVLLKCVLFQMDCNATPFCCPSPRNHYMKHVVQGGWFVPPLLSSWIPTERRQSITFLCPANSAGHCPLSLHLTWVCTSLCMVCGPWAN